ncbi:uncharacterized protein LOC129966566 isoform X2 [Argiope bruennichi]|uniref:uncharacterized protein LOC129966566 isoform X2 n=1 Tax=Argiope bruennichi TaxID=94029 RepID=UPI002494EEB7|nr:uncharacterized protein LOC129966566 isoform X2 [Argiope bruennichi]XP_055936993.1 uncharacterized protein LOC129966566 isoform X2 [Argiope bruennichi]
MCPRAFEDRGFLFLVIHIMISSRIFIGWCIILCVSISVSFSSYWENKIGGDKDKSCITNADCSENECCTFEAVPTLDDTTDIIWKCKPLGGLKDLCHSLGNVHCPCQPGLRCIAKAVWFFGSGMCGEKSKL